MFVSPDRIALTALAQREARHVAATIVPCVVLAAMASSMAFPILPVQASRLGMALPLIGVMLAANRVGRIAATPAVGAWVDRTSPRRVLCAGMVLQAVALGLFILGLDKVSPGLLLIAGRLLQGVASAGIFVAAQVLALRAGTAAQSGRVGGLVRAAMAAGVPLGLAAGGLLSERYGATQVFEGAMLATLAGCAIARALLDDERIPARAGASFAQMLRQLADLRLAALGAVSFAGSFAAHGVVMTTLPLLVQARGISVGGLGVEGTSGVLMGAMVILIALGSPLAGALGDKRQWHSGVAAAGLVGCVPALLATGLATGFAGLGLGIVLIGVSAAALGPSLLALVSQATPAASRGGAVSLVQLLGDLGGLLGPIVCTLVVTRNPGTPYLVSAALLLLAFPALRVLARWNLPERLTP